MTPTAIKQYLVGRRLATLKDIALHFRMEADAVSPMLELWIRKGKVKRHNDRAGCRKGCGMCDSAALTTYEWVG